MRRKNSSYCELQSFKDLSFKRGRILCLLFKSGRDLTSMSLQLLFRNGSDIMSIYKHKVSLAPKQFLLLPPSIYLCLGLWSGLHCALECFIPMGGGHSQNMWDSAVTSFYDPYFGNAPPTLGLLSNIKHPCVFLANFRKNSTSKMWFQPIQRIFQGKNGPNLPNFKKLKKFQLPDFYNKFQ